LIPDDFGRDTSVILVNALYFQGGWDTQFDSVSSRPFYISTERTINTQFLEINTDSCDDIRLAELPDVSARLLDLPYKVTA
jgi:serine protease inhibitor